MGTYWFRKLLIWSNWNTCTTFSSAERQLVEVNSVLLPSSAQTQLSCAELALVLINPAGHLPGPEIAGNEQRMLSNICRPTPVKLKTTLNILEDGR